MVCGGDRTSEDLPGTHEGIHGPEGPARPLEESEHRGTDTESSTESQQQTTNRSSFDGRLLESSGTGGTRSDDLPDPSQEPGAIPEGDAVEGPTQVKIKPKRLRKKETAPDVWKAHRKLRKKLASAKWYAKKKKVIVAQKEALQKQLEEAHRERQRKRLWTPEQYMYWRCATEHALHDFPVRPESIPPDEWLYMIDMTYAAMARMHEVHTEVSWHTRERKRALKHLALRELLKERSMKRMPSVPSSCQTVTKKDVSWKKWTMGAFPSICSTLGWIFTGMFTAGIQATHWPWFCRSLEHRSVHPHVWVDDDILHLRRELDRLCTPSDHTQRTATSHSTMDELDSLPSSLDSLLHDTFGDFPIRSPDPQQDPKSPNSHTSNQREPASFNPWEWDEWDIDDIIIHDPIGPE